jgi:opacity protein-like surface antigen
MTKAMTKLAVAFAALLPTTALADWNGTYIGGSYGSATGLSYDLSDNNQGADFDLPDSDSTGLFIGSRAQVNNFVWGGEIAIEFTPDADVLDAGVILVDSLIDLKFTVGLPFGSALAYGILSVSGASGTYGPNDINAGGFGIGAGAAVKLGDHFSISAEYLSRSMTEEYVQTDVDVTADTLTLRAAFHF